MAMEQCTLDSCPESFAVYGYRPNLGINVFFAVVFSFIAIWTTAIAIWKRRWISYSVVIAVGAILELVGYISRDLGWADPFDVNYFSIQFTLLTLAPVFTTAGICLSLKYLASRLGPGYLNISSKFYTSFFIPSDVVALIIQAVGGGLATSESTSDNPPSPSDGLLVGTKITIAGLALQVASLTVFLVLFLGVVLPRRGRTNTAEPKAPSSEPFGEVPISVDDRKISRRRLLYFIFTLLLATVLILIRSCYRVAELSQGLSSSLATDQWLFVGLDGFMVAIATSMMAIVHPAFILEE
ncbi:RTA1 like protein [Hypomontagnella monticulosa]|nr:RTA1 like protein [Hypomontagnella monticulosa]